MYVRVGVKSNKEHIGDHARALRRLGLSLSEDRSRYLGYCSERRAKKIKYFCKTHHLTFYYDNEYGERSSYYRRAFFANHKPDIGNKYICVYCGRRKKKDDITVDHLYPVGQVSKNLKLQKKLKKRGINSLNSPENLVAACMHCNMKKSDKMGWWIIKGRLGQHKGLWFFRWGISWILFLAAIAMVVFVFVPAVRPEWLSFLGFWFP